MNVERTPTDERHSELAFAISDAFKHVRQQLHEQVRRRATVNTISCRPAFDNARPGQGRNRYLDPESGWAGVTRSAAVSHPRFRIR